MKVFKRRSQILLFNKFIISCVNILENNMFSYKGLLLLTTIIGIILIITSVIRAETSCPKQQIIYKYIPRTFEQEEEEPVYVSDIFSTMFTQPSVWTSAVNNIDRKKQEQINNFFISQA